MRPYIRRRGELRRVQQVEALGAKLGDELVVLDASYEVLYQYYIGIASKISTHIRQPRAQIAEGEGRGVDESSSIEPVRNGRIIKMRAAA